MCDAMSEYYDCLRNDDDAFAASLLTLSLACVCFFPSYTRKDVNHEEKLAHAMYDFLSKQLNETHNKDKTRTHTHTRRHVDKVVCQNLEIWCPLVSRWG